MRNRSNREELTKEEPGFCRMPMIFRARIFTRHFIWHFFYSAFYLAFFYSAFYSAFFFIRHFIRHFSFTRHFTWHFYQVTTWKASINFTHKQYWSLHKHHTYKNLKGKTNKQQTTPTHTMTTKSKLSTRLAYWIHKQNQWNWAWNRRKATGY